MTPFAPRAADRRLLPEGWLTGPMPWVVAILTFLTTLAAAGGLGLAGAASGLGEELAGKLTVQIVESNPDSRERQARAVLAELPRFAQVDRVERVDEAHMRALLAPWLGDEGLEADDLPVPALIDVSLRAGADADEVAHTVRAVAPGARVDRHATWLGPLESLLRELRWLSGGLILLMGAAMAAAVVLAARGALNSHRETIDVMHLIGASDVQIARLFERRAALDALAGSLAGFGLGAIVILLLGGRLNAIGAALLDQAGLGVGGWLMLAALPVAAVALTLLTARITILRALERTL